MFSGIVTGIFPVSQVLKNLRISYAITLPSQLLNGLNVGASLAIDGVCQTVVKIEGNDVYFDLLEESRRVTTLSELRRGRLVNVERALKIGEEVGGHLLSGHVMGKVRIKEKTVTSSDTIVRFSLNEEWKKYVFNKGFIAIDGVSLTVVDIDPLSVHIIPETLRLTTLGFKEPGELLNIEIDSQTQTIVDSIERLLIQKKHS